MPRDERLRALLDEALATLDPADATLRARVLARLVGTAPYSESIATRMELAGIGVTELSGDYVTVLDPVKSASKMIAIPPHDAKAPFAWGQDVPQPSPY